MPKYLIQFSYSDAGMAAMIDNPASREPAVRHVVESVGGTLECFYWMHGAYDGMVIVNAPDSVTVAGVDAAIKSTGFAHSVATQLFESDDIHRILEVAERARSNFAGPQ